MLKKKKLNKKLNFLFQNKNLNFQNDKQVSFLRREKVYFKSKVSKVRLFCKNIVLLTILLTFLLISELHFIYYSISINAYYFKHLVYFFEVFFISYIFVKNKLWLIKINSFFSLIWKLIKSIK